MDINNNSYKRREVKTDDDWDKDDCCREVPLPISVDREERERGGGG
jgi:hypothetical protein